LEDLKRPQNEIGFILNVAEEVDVNPRKVVAMNHRKGVAYHKIPLKDGAPIPAEKMREAIQVIRQHIGSEKVLVACHYGVGRSASILMGYLCSAGMGYEEAFNLVSSKRPRVEPLPGLPETIRETLHNVEEVQRCISP